MGRNERIVWVTGIAAVVVIGGLVVGADLFRGRSASVDCGDGPRRTIDLRDFATTYAASAIEIEAQLGPNGKVAGRLEPRQVQALTEASQQANEYRKFVVAGYNSCAVSAADYARLGTRYQAIEAVARQINAIAAQPDLSDAERETLAELVQRYTEEVARLTSEVGSAGTG